MEQMVMDWQKIESELRKPLAPEAIKPPAPGKYGDYVDGLHVISEANRIFGHGGWSYTVTRMEQASGQVFDLPNKGQQYRCSWMCTVRLEVGDVTREGAAVGTGSGKPENMGDAIESAVKEAETDALKRALRTMGNTFGLALYEKDKSKRQIGNGNDVDRVISDMTSAQTGRDLLAVVEAANNMNSLDAVTAARVAKLREIVKAASSPEALNALAKHFGPDWPAVKADAEQRAKELAAPQGNDEIPL
jgi:recombination DNA repair RAD52 pathway protein